ncbi:hypothetical protein QL285_071659 [Trifolium repens]|nr:hypothetical protein QL285_071659 [Trifolium repens]
MKTSPSLTILRFNFQEEHIAVMRCHKAVNDGNYWDISSEMCGGTKKQYYYSYVVVNGFNYEDFFVRNIEESCRIEMKVMVKRWDEKVKCNSMCEYPEVHREYVNGIEVRWRPLRCEEDGDKESDWYGEKKQQLPLRCTIADAAVTCLSCYRIAS